MIDRSAEVDSSASIGPGVVVGPNVRIGPETTIGPYAVIERDTSIGRGNRIWQFAAIGADTQDQKYHGEPSRLEIGDYNQIREFSTIHRGSEAGGMVTRIRNHVVVMNYSHVAHDCDIGDHVIISNSSEIGGHAVLEEWVIASGMVGVHQFTRIGAHAFLAGGAMVAQDVPPYAMVAGDRARLVGINEIGLQRRGFKPETISAIKSATRTLFYSKMLREEAIKKVLDEHRGVPEVERLVNFIVKSERGVVGRERE